MNIEKVEGEGLGSLMGQRITLFCMNYIYTGKLGKLVGVNTDAVMLEDAAIVFETGSFGDAKWKDAQPLPKPLYIRVAAIDALGREYLVNGLGEWVATE